MGGHSQRSLDREQVIVRPGSLLSKLPIIGGICAVVGILGAFVVASGHTPIEQAQFWSAYLTSMMFALALGLGGMFFVILQHITRAQWSITVRRLAEGLMISVPFVALMGLPLFFFGGGHHEEHAEHDAHAEHGSAHGDAHDKGKIGAACSAKSDCASVLECDAGKCAEPHKALLPGSHHIYEWTHTHVVENDPLLKAKAPYLNEGSQKVRYIVYILIWSLIAGFMWTWSVKQDNAVDPVSLTHRQRWWAPLCLLTFSLSVTFAAFDLLMSLDPHWFSTIFGVYYFIGGVVSVHALLVIISVLFQSQGYLQGVVTREHYHDLGKFMFGFTVFWAYTAFSQYFLIWYASVPEETDWFAYRGFDQWLTLSICLVFGRFVLPWFALLRQPIKRNPKILVLIACFILVMEYVDIYWLVMPAFDKHQHHYGELAGLSEQAMSFHGKIAPTLAHVLTLLGFGGVVTAVFGYAVSKFALVPLKDPRLLEALNHENR